MVRESPIVSCIGVQHGCLADMLRQRFELALYRPGSNMCCGGGGVSFGLVGVGVGRVKGGRGDVPSGRVTDARCSQCPWAAALLAS